MGVSDNTSQMIETALELSFNTSYESINLFISDDDGTETSDLAQAVFETHLPAQIPITPLQINDDKIGDIGKASIPNTLKINISNYCNTFLDFMYIENGAVSVPTPNESSAPSPTDVILLTNSDDRSKLEQESAAAAKTSVKPDEAALEVLDIDLQDGGGKF